jgi:hypothetical protein
VVPSADPTAAPLGHWAAAVEAVGVAAAVASGAEADAVGVDPLPVPSVEAPQAASGAAIAKEMSRIQRELLRVTGIASFYDVEL